MIKRRVPVVVSVCVLYVCEEGGGCLGPWCVCVCEDGGGRLGLWRVLCVC